MYRVGGINWEPKSSITDLIEMLETEREKSTCLKIKLLAGKTADKLHKKQRLERRQWIWRTKKMSQHKIIMSN